MPLVTKLTLGIDQPPLPPGNIRVSEVCIGQDVEVPAHSPSHSNRPHTRSHTTTLPHAVPRVSEVCIGQEVEVPARGPSEYIIQWIVTQIAHVSD